MNVVILVLYVPYVPSYPREKNIISFHFFLFIKKLLRLKIGKKTLLFSLLKWKASKLIYLINSILVQKKVLQNFFASYSTKRNFFTPYLNHNRYLKIKKLGQILSTLLDKTINKTVHDLVKVAILFRFLTDEKTSMNICFS